MPLADAAADARPDARGPQPALTKTLYLSFDGVTLLPGEDDATTNRSAFASQPIVLAPFLEGDPARPQKLDDITLELRSLVAPYDITILTERPAAGTYAMLVLTDDSSSELGLAPDQVAVTRSSCNRRASPISFEHGYHGTDLAVRNAIAMFGNHAAIPFTKKRGDCMCFSHLVCSVTVPCTIGGPETPVDTSAGCATDEVTMDVAARFLDVFGARP